MSGVGAGARGSSVSASEALVETFAYYKYEVTPFEADLWRLLIDEYGDASVVSFLSHHIRSSAFAPKVSDAQRMLNPARANADAAFLAVQEQVRLCGPYRDPSFADPAVTLAIARMGGWVAVNEQLPTPEQRFDLDAFQKRFEVAYQLSLAESRQGAPRLELRGLHALGYTPGAQAMRPSSGDADPPRAAVASHRPGRSAA